MVVGSGGGGCLASEGNDGIPSVVPLALLLLGSLSGDDGSKSLSSSFNPSQSAPDLLRTGLLDAEGEGIDLCSDFRSLRFSEENLQEFLPSENNFKDRLMGSKSKG